MKWLWRKEAHTPVLDTSGDLGGDLTLLNLLIPGESWELVADNLGFADALCTDKDGNLYFCDMKAPAVYPHQRGRRHAHRDLPKNRSAVWNSVRMVRCSTPARVRRTA